MAMIYRRRTYNFRFLRLTVAMRHYVTVIWIWSKGTMGKEPVRDNFHRSPFTRGHDPSRTEAIEAFSDGILISYVTFTGPPQECL